MSRLALLMSLLLLAGFLALTSESKSLYNRARYLDRRGFVFPEGDFEQQQKVASIEEGDEDEDEVEDEDVDEDDEDDGELVDVEYKVNSGLPTAPSMHHPMNPEMAYFGFDYPFMDLGMHNAINEDEAAKTD